MFETFTVINLIYWLVWRPISFVLRWLISRDEEYLRSVRQEEEDRNRP